MQPDIVNRITQPANDGSAVMPAAEQQQIPFTNSAEQEVAKVTLGIVKKFERLPRSVDLKSPEIQEKIVQEVAAVYIPAQGVLEGVTEQPDIPQVVAKTVEYFIDRSIDIPRIVVVPKEEITSGFYDFDLDVSGIRLQPVAMDILIQSLMTNQRERLVNGTGIVREKRPEDYLVRALMDFDDISYDDHADLLYKLAGQVVSHLGSYLPDEDSVENVLLFNQQRLSALIYSQMQAHYWESATDYEAHVSKGFTTLRENSYSAVSGDGVRNFRQPVEESQYIRGMVFGGFRRCLYPIQKFDSDPERRFAILLEDEQEELKWFKPAKGQFHIYSQNDKSYEPDFVVETGAAKFLCEPKRANEIDDEEVQAKARAAVEWCRRATAHELEHGGKPWSYLLIPHDAITANRTLSALAASFTVG